MIGCLQIAGKQAAFHAIAEYYQSLVSKANKAIGEELAWLQVSLTFDLDVVPMLMFFKIVFVMQHAMELFKASQQRSGRVIYPEIQNKAQRNFAEAEKDNNFIYHDRIPDLSSLPAIGKAQPAKILQMSHPLSQNFKGTILFNCFVTIVFVIYLKNCLLHLFLNAICFSFYCFVTGFCFVLSSIVYKDNISTQLIFDCMCLQICLATWCRCLCTKQWQLMKFEKQKLSTVK